MEDITCSVVDCDEPPKRWRFGWCGRHYQKWKKYGDPLGGLVRRKHPPGCEVEDCPRPYASRGYCQRHYVRWKKYGSPLIVFASHDGSGYVNAGGYRVLHRPGHPLATKKGAVLEHRLVMAELLGRDLYPDETVHHVNGNRLDNRPENLEVWSGNQPRGARAADLLAWAREVIARYAGTPLDPQVGHDQGSDRS